MANQNIKRYTFKEEIFNSVTHGVGILLSVIGASVMVTLAACYGNTRAVISGVVFGLALVIMYTMSTLYHAFPEGKVKALFRVFDHTAIPILIAGSYTPFCVIALKDSPKAQIVILAVWVLCIICVCLTTINLEKYEKLSLVLYILMGWCIILVIKDVVNALSTQAFMLLLLGGISYSVGIIFYKMKKVRYAHGVWHLFVLGGSLLHYLCFVIYLI